MSRRPPKTKRTATPLPYTTLFRSKCFIHVRDLAGAALWPTGYSQHIFRPTGQHIRESRVMAGSVNKVILVGNLGRDPEVRTMQNGGKVCKDRKSTRLNSSH